MSKEEIMWEDYGESSLTLLSAHCGITKQNPTLPLDKHDFKRCLHLFDCLGLNGDETYALVKKTALKYPKWKSIFNNWTELLDCYFSEHNSLFYKKLDEISLTVHEKNIKSTPRSEE